MRSKALAWLGTLTFAGLIAVATSSATSTGKRPPVPHRGEVAIGAYQCGLNQEQTQGFAGLTIGGTSGIGSTFLQGQFPTAPGNGTPLNCAQLAEQVAADAAAGACSVGPITELPGEFGSPSQTTVHFVCSGTHDEVIAAIAEIHRNFAVVTTAGALL
jgi:hypothetical protein